MMIVCIDSQIFVWGIKKQATVGQEDMILRAERFFNLMDEKKDELLIPSICIAEVLTPEPIDKYGEWFEIINKHFRVIDLDSRVAAKYGQLLNGKFGDMKQLAKDNGIRREKMKFDHVVIACAVIGKADHIVSFDPGLRKFSEGIITVKDLPQLPPPIPIQISIFT